MTSEEIKERIKIFSQKPQQDTWVSLRESTIALLEIAFQLAKQNEVSKKPPSAYGG